MWALQNYRKDGDRYDARFKAPGLLKVRVLSDSRMGMKTATF